MHEDGGHREGKGMDGEVFRVLGPHCGISDVKVSALIPASQDFESALIPKRGMRSYGFDHAECTDVAIDSRSDMREWIVISGSISFL